MKITVRCDEVTHGRGGASRALFSLTAGHDQKDNERFIQNQPDGGFHLSGLKFEDADAFDVGKKYVLELTEAPADSVVNHESKDQPTAMNPVQTEDKK